MTGLPKQYNEFLPKDFSLESQIEAVLDANEMIYERDEEWLSDERMQLTTYTMDVFIDPTTTEV